MKMFLNVSFHHESNRLLFPVIHNYEILYTPIALLFIFFSDKTHFDFEKLFCRQMSTTCLASYDKKISSNSGKIS